MRRSTAQLPSFAAARRALHGLYDLIEIGATMRASSVGEVIESRNPRDEVSDKVMGIFGWQEYAAVDEAQVMRRVPENDLPLSAALGVLALTASRPFSACWMSAGPSPVKRCVCRRWRAPSGRS
jgi:NADPH-dependent curcumin reductase CurA